MRGFCLSDYLDQQRQEALGAVNKWYCSQYHGYEVTDPNILLAYYIKHGGATHFCLENQIQAQPVEHRAQTG